MSKRSVVTSIAASMVLASVLVLSGCGGSNSGNNSDGMKSSVKAPGLNPGSEGTTGKQKLVVEVNKATTFDITGNTGDNSGVAGKVSFSNLTDGKGNRSCGESDDNEDSTSNSVTTSGGCNITVVIQTPSCGCSDSDASEDTDSSTNSGGCVEREEADLRYTSNYGNAALDYANDHRDELEGYDPITDMLVYGGAIVMDVSGFSKGDVKIDVKGTKCGKSINHKTGEIIGQAGFANPDHIVFALVKVHDKDGNQVIADQWVPIDHMDEDGNFTIDLNGLELGSGDNEVEVLLFSNKPAEGAHVNGSTGISGAGS